MASRIAAGAALIAALIVPALESSAQTASVPSFEDKAAAYALFLQGRYLEGEGDLDGAVRSYRRAAELDPTSGEVLAELASLYARRNRGDEAIAAATEALARDPDNLTAHRILGLIYAARSASRDGVAGDAALAIDHLLRTRGTLLPDLQVELTLARLYLMQGEYGEAIPVLEQLLEDEVGFSEAALLLSDAYEAEDRPDDAIAVLEGVAGNSRPSFRVLSRLGHLYEAAGRLSDAVEAYELAVARNPSSRSARQALADVLIRVGELERGRDVLLDILSLREDDASALYELSAVERVLGNLQAAEDVAHRLIELEPEGLRGRIALAEVQSRRYAHRAVIDTLEQALQTTQARNATPAQRASLLERIGFSYEQLQDPVSASRKYAEALALVPTSLLFGAHLTQAYLDAGQVDDARRVLEDMQAHHPGDMTLLRLNAKLYAAQGDVEGGVALLQDALAEHEDDPLAHMALAGFLSEHDRFGDAADLLAVARDRFPADLSILFQLGAVLERNAQYADAERAFREVLARNPEHADTLNYLGYMLADRGERLEESIDLLERAIEIDPHNGAYLDSLGWAYFKLDRLDLAETNLRQASEQMIWNSVIQDHLGDLLFRQGRYEEAISAWETALAGDGEEIESHVVRQKIEAAQQQLDR